VLFAYLKQHAYFALLYFGFIQCGMESCDCDKTMGVSCLTFMFMYIITSLAVSSSCIKLLLLCVIFVFCCLGMCIPPCPLL
jgi:hypothetical protein